LLFIFSSLTEIHLIVGDDEEKVRKSLLSAFSMVKFPNTLCDGSLDSRKGTCYTDTECEELNGIASGSCADGYGICCLFVLNCGDESSENSTYFQSSGYFQSGVCNAKICPMTSDICQLRLDFISFNIAEPSTSTVTVANSIQGMPLGGATTTPVSKMGQCLTDSFTVTSPGSTAPPEICGFNTNEHMYVEASNECNILSLSLAGTVDSSWHIQIIQLACDSNSLAPRDCTQYYFGQTFGTVHSYNYYGGLHLANQNQLICIRKELNRCRICYSTAMGNDDFDISGTIASMAMVGYAGMCCGYGTDGKATKGFDCVIIPGASRKTAKTSSGVTTNGDIKDSEFCGRQLGVHETTETMGARATICSKNNKM